MPKPTIAVPSAELVAIIAPHPPTLAPTASVLEAIAQIVSESNRCPLSSETNTTHPQALEHCVLVLEDDRLVGIVTAGDLVRLSATGQSLATTPIAEIMSAPVQTLDLADLADPFVALRLFEQYAISHLPIVDEQGRIVGLLTCNRLLQRFPSLNLLRLSSIAEVMTQTEVQALPTTPLAELTQLMAAHAVGWVVIGEAEEQATAGEKQENSLQPLDDRKLKPIGIVTHQAIVQALALELDLAAVQAQTVMAERSAEIGVADSAWDAYQIMQARAVNQVIVTHDRGWLLGMVTRSNLLGALNPLTLYRMTEQLMQERTEARQQAQAELAERQRVEATLGASEERWQLTLQGNNDGIWDWNLITHQIFFSSRWKQMRGFAEDEIGDSPNECLGRIHPDDYDRVIAEMNDHFAGKTEFFEAEYRSQCKDGSYIWVLDRAQSLRDEAGQVIRMSGSDTDITSRKLAEAALRESERRYATLAAAAPVAIFQFDSLFNLVYANDRWSQMTGRSVESSLGDRWVEALHPDDREVLLAKWTEMHAQAPPGTQVLNGGEGRHLRPDGSINWFYVQVAREMDAEGNIVGYIGTLTDITERKHAEQQLQHLSDRLELAIKSAQIGIWEWDIESNSLIWDDRMCSTA
jgi:PAS domain S-box-containing protein